MIPTLRLTGRILLLVVLGTVVSVALLSSSNGTRAQETPSAFPDRPTNLRAESTGAGIVLSWDAPVEGPVAGYRIARIWLDSAGLENLTRVVDTHSTSTTYTDVRIEINVLYVYYVRAIFGNGTTGSWSRAVNVRALSALPAIPTPRPPEYRWYVVQGELPPGLFLDQRTGQLYGVPGEVGHYNVMIQRQRIDDGS